MTRRRRSGEATLNIYQLEEDYAEHLEVLKFETANGEWLDFVVNNRKVLLRDNTSNLVIGPVANDSTLPVIDDYMDGKYDKEEAVKRLLPQNLTDQYAFLTDKALNLLQHERSVKL